MGQYIPWYININDRPDWCRKIKKVLKEDVIEFCTYHIEDQLFMARFEMQEPYLVSIVEYNITGLDMSQIFELDWW